MFNGSGVLVENWNQGNRDRCDIIILGSDVAALRGENYDKNKAIYLAYSPIVIVGQKEKLDAARVFRGQEGQGCFVLRRLAVSRPRAVWAAF